MFIRISKSSLISSSVHSVLSLLKKNTKTWKIDESTSQLSVGKTNKQLQNTVHYSNNQRCLHYTLTLRHYKMSFCLNLRCDKMCPHQERQFHSNYNKRTTKESYTHSWVREIQDPDRHLVWCIALIKVDSVYIRHGTK